MRSSRSTAAWSTSTAFGGRPAEDDTTPASPTRGSLFCAAAQSQGHWLTVVAVISRAKPSVHSSRAGDGAKGHSGTVECRGRADRATPDGAVSDAGQLRGAADSTVQHEAWYQTPDNDPDR